jgi:hypothetical protein
MREPESSSENNNVKLSLNEHVTIIKHFSIFSSFYNQIELFLCHWTHKLEGYKCSWNVRSKGATQKTLEGYKCSLNVRNKGATQKTQEDE